VQCGRRYERQTAGWLIWDPSVPRGSQGEPEGNCSTSESHHSADMVMMVKQCYWPVNLDARRQGEFVSEVKRHLNPSRFLAARAIVTASSLVIARRDILTLVHLAPVDIQHSKPSTRLDIAVLRVRTFFSPSLHGSPAA
jgi:hypothetical protein